MRCCYPRAGKAGSGVPSKVAIRGAPKAVLAGILDSGLIPRKRMS
jgi:hypothetical protein